MSRRAGLMAGVGALALGLAPASGAEAAVISFTPDAPLSATPVTISFGGGLASYAFTSATTPFGPGAAVATSGTATVATLFGDVADFAITDTDAVIGPPPQLYTFAAAPTASVIPFSAANDFIGLAFNLGNGLQYGYAEVEGPRLVSYAFESTPGVGIRVGAVGAVTAVPEPASLALLLAGVAGVAATRRRART